MDGWVDGWMVGEAGLRIAYNNQKMHKYCKKLKNIKITILMTTEL